jgi:diacylglycerol kinase (ATP)
MELESIKGFYSQNPSSIGVALVIIVCTSFYALLYLTNNNTKHEEEDWWPLLSKCQHSKLVLPPQAFQSIKINGKLLDGKILPHLVPQDVVPLLCFVNSRSGGNNGKIVMGELKRLLNPIQVVDILESNPLKVLEAFSVISSFRVLVCGGDGTVCWVLSEIENLHIDSRPPVAIYPLGTGNDLARVMGWGAGIGLVESLSDFLYSVQHASITVLDRWDLKIINNNKNSNNNSNEFKIKKFNNYFGIGVDAQIVLKFHDLRERKPHRFFHQSVNKLWYGITGMKEIWRRNCSDLPKYLKLVIDGKDIDIPEDTEGIIVTNISSYGGGMCLWNHHVSKHDSDEENESPQTDSNAWKQSSAQDGLLEVLCVNGSAQLARTKVGIDQCVKLGQGSSIEIVTTKAMPVHIDGEPWAENSCKLNISLFSKALMLRRTYPQTIVQTISDSYQNSNGSTELLLDWGERSNVISSSQRRLLLMELSRRNEEGLIKSLHQEDDSRVMFCK